MKTRVVLRSGSDNPDDRGPSLIQAALAANRRSADNPDPVEIPGTGTTDFSPANGFAVDRANTDDQGRSRFMNRGQLALILLSHLLSLGAVSGLAGCASAPPATAQLVHAVQIPAAQRDFVWERAVDTLNRFHFAVARESKLEGVIETEYRTGSNLLEAWHPDSLGFHNRLESTLQSIRRRVFVTMQSSQPGLVTVSVRADKEIEDLPGLAANYEGGATFSESRPLDRDLNQVVGQSGPSRWIYIGRDAALERALLNEIGRGPTR